MVLQVKNSDCHLNWDWLPNPPSRTGKLDALMDEVEAVTVREDCQFVWVDKVANGFLPANLERRGYQRVPSPDGFPNPDYLKILTVEERSAET